MEKVVITGSSGRIGRALHWRLAQEFEVIGLDLSPSSATSQIADIRDYDQLLRSFEGASTVFHSAALHAPHVGVASEKSFYEINVGATEKVCRAALESGVSQVVFTSTTALYGYTNQAEGEAVWIDEETIPRPKTIYHQTKWEAEQILKSYSGQNLRVRIIRMSRCFPEPVQIMTVYRLHRGIDYRDVAEAHRAASKLSKDDFFETFVVSGKTPFLKSDVQGLFENPEFVIRERVPQLASEFDRRGWKFPRSIDRVYDSSHALLKLNWKSQRGYSEVIKQYDNEDFEVLHPF